MPLERSKLEKFQDQFEPLFKKVTNKDPITGKDAPIPLTQQEVSYIRPILIEYYAHLKEDGNQQESKYGELALGVRRDDTTAGKVANAHMTANALHKGLSQAEISTMKDGVPVYLVGNDIQMRINTLAYPIDNPSSRHIEEIIANYHYAAFKAYDCGKLCWTGAIFDIFAGDRTAWFKIATGDKSLPKMGLGNIVESYKNNEIKDGIGAVDAVNSLARTANYEFDQNLGDYYITIKGKTLFVPPVDPFNPDSYLLDAYAKTNSAKMFPTIVRNLIQDQFNPSIKETTSLPNFIRDNPDFTKTESGANKINQILSKADQDLVRKVANLLFPEEVREDSCKAEANTGGSCKAENLDDIQGKGTYFNPDEVQKLYKTLDKKGIILDRPIISDDIRQSSSAHEDLNSKTHVVRYGETVWSIAKANGISVNELISIEGNSFLLDNRYVDGKNRDNIKIAPGQIINIKNINLYKGDKASGFEGSTFGSYDFMSDFSMPISHKPFSLLGLYEEFKKWQNKYENLFMNTEHDEVKNKYEVHKHEYLLLEESRVFNKYKDSEWESRYMEELGAFKKQHSEGRKIYSTEAWDIGISAKSERGGHTFKISFGFGFPVVLDLEGSGLKLVGLEDSHAFFDMNNNGYLENTGWIQNGMGILCYDIGQDGVIEQTKEISFKLWDNTAISDLDGLKFFDKNKDGKLDIQDDGFDNFFIWQDYDKNGFSQPHELKKLKELGITSIFLDSIETDMSFQADNKILGVANIERHGVISPNLYDIAFKYTEIGIKYQEDYSEIVFGYSDNKKLFAYIIEDDKGEYADLSNTNYEIAIGNKGDDIIIGHNNNVIIDGGAGNDKIMGGEGNDWLKGGIGSDTIIGGAGNDILLIDEEDKQDNIDGGEGYDVVLVSTSKAVELDLAKANIEAVYGNKGNDIFIAGKSKVGVYIDGGEGDDIIIGSDYNDILIGGKGADKITCGKGDDMIFIDKYDTLNDCHEGEKTLYIMGDGNIEIDTNKINVKYIFIESDHNDVNLKISGNNDLVLKGGKGNNVLEGGSGFNIFDAGEGDNTLIAGTGNNVFIVGEGESTIIL